MAAPSAFARAQLKKYGWKEGKGLGKHENGISTAIKPKLKFNKNGLGHDVGLEYKCSWWDQAFNKAASNVIVNNDISDSGPVFMLTENKKRKRPNSEMKQYANFVIAKTSPYSKEINQIQKAETECDPFNLNDDIFEKCDGRTVHKASRLGYGMNAKLNRLKEQESSFAEQFSTVKNKNR